MTKEEIKESVRKAYKKAFHVEPSKEYLDKMVEIISKEPDELNK